MNGKRLAESSSCRGSANNHQSACRARPAFTTSRGSRGAPATRWRQRGLRRRSRPQRNTLHPRLPDHTPAPQVAVATAKAASAAGCQSCSSNCLLLQLLEQLQELLQQLPTQLQYLAATASAAAEATSASPAPVAATAEADSAETCRRCCAASAAEAASTSAQATSATEASAPDWGSPCATANAVACAVAQSDRPRTISEWRRRRLDGQGPGASQPGKAVRSMPRSRP